MNRVCRTEGHDYPVFAPRINGVTPIPETTLITGPCRRCGLDSELDPAILSKRLKQLRSDVTRYLTDVIATKLGADQVRMAMLEARLAKLETPVTGVNNIVSSDSDEARHIAYREGRLAAWRELREWAEQNVGVAEAAPDVQATKP